MSAFVASWLALLTPGLAAPRPQTPLHETAEPYRIVAAAALPVLPEALRGAIEVRLDRVLAVATADLLQTGPDDAAAARAPEHFVLLDAAEPTADWPKRLAAARSFPREAAASAKLFAARGRASCGSLPWTILTVYASLRDGFRTRDSAVVVHQCGALLHFVTDAALPFHLTIDVESGGLSTPSGPPEPSSSSSQNLDRTLAWRCEAGVLPMLQGRLTYEVRVAPTRYGRVGDPAAATFSLLGDSYEALQELFNTDAQIMRSLAISDETSFATLRDGYYERLARGIAPTVEERLEAAALLLAGLIGTAWEDAGRPVLTETAPAETAAPSPAVAAPTDSTPGPVVGSRESTVFHTTLCAHMKRVKPSNLVRFDSAEAALAAGRTPCRACKPVPP